MYILQLEHAVKNYDEWRKVFESDPLKRKASGVRGYCLSRRADNPNYVIGDLEFDDLKEAQDFLTRLESLWSGGSVKMIENPRARIIEVIESKEY